MKKAKIKKGKITITITIGIMAFILTMLIFIQVKTISQTDISDSTNFVLKIPSENKTVDFGDGSNINVKILWIIDLMNNKEKGVPGTIVLNVPNIKKVYFREQVWEER